MKVFPDFLVYFSTSADLFSNGNKTPNLFPQSTDRAAIFGQGLSGLVLIIPEVIVNRILFFCFVLFCVMQHTMVQFASRARGWKLKHARRDRDMDHP